MVFCSKEPMKLSLSDTHTLIGQGAVKEISWRSNKQTFVALSACEAEYIASSLACNEAIWLSRLLSDMLQLNKKKYIESSSDSSGAIATVKNLGINQRNKHIDLKYHFVCYQYEKSKVQLIKCPTKDQAADMFTKGLGRVKFEYFRDQLGVISISQA